MVQTQENGKKNHFGPDLGLLEPNSSHWFFFFSNMASSVTRYYGQISSCTISEKTNDSIFGKFSERRTDKLIDRQKDESNFIWRFPTNVDRAITILMCYMDDWSIFYSLLLSLIYKTYLHKSKTYIQK